MKKTLTGMLLAILLLFVFVAVAVSIESGTRTLTGKVIGIDSAGKGIAISSMAGGKEIVAGAIVNDSTDVRVKGRKADIKDIKNGDTVSLTYSYENNDLYAKKVVKK
jgi:hypothetical protein